MEITLKAVKTAAFASEETRCFTATVLIDGKPAGRVDNDGRGGSHRYFPHDLERRLAAHAATLPQRALNMGAGREPVMFQPDADTLIDDALEAHDLDRLLAKRIVVLDAKGRILQTRALPKDQRDAMLAPARIDATKRDLKAAAILNVMPRAEALQAFRAGACA